MVNEFTIVMARHGDLPRAALRQARLKFSQVQTC
jgi:hypothetical protein